MKNQTTRTHRTNPSMRTPSMSEHASWLRQAGSLSAHRHALHPGATPSAAPQATALTAREAARVQRYQHALLRAIDLRDREALQQAKAHVLRAAYQHASTNQTSYGMRTALRALVWRMSGLLIPRHQRHW